MRRFIQIYHEVIFSLIKSLSHHLSLSLSVHNLISLRVLFIHASVVAAFALGAFSAVRVDFFHVLFEPALFARVSSALGIRRFNLVVVMVLHFRAFPIFLEPIEGYALTHLVGEDGAVEAVGRTASSDRVEDKVVEVRV